MGANKFEKFESVVIKRIDIKKADYNPRKISDSAAKKLRKFLKENGLWSPLTVNKRTMTLVSGHQRLTAMDALLGPEYDITVAMVDVDERTEVMGNVFMNNPSAMGEWDMVALGDLKNIFEDLDFETDLGFDASDLDIMFGKESESKTEIKEKSKEFSTDQFREMKKEQRDTARAKNEEDGEYHLGENDYAVTFVFPNNREKRVFMAKIKKDQKETHLKSTVLWDIWKQVYNLSSIEE